MAVAVGLAAMLVLVAAAAVEATDAKKPVKVFILAGQSNMEGKAKVELLEYQVKQPATRDLFKHLQKDGKWVERDGVWIKFLDRKGNVALVKTDQFWDLEAEAVYKKGWRQNLEEWKTVGSDWPFHYLGSAKTLCAIGKAFGEARMALRGEKK
jgi:hypothetical protein